MNTYVIEVEGYYLKFNYSSPDDFINDVFNTAKKLEKKLEWEYDEYFDQGTFSLAGIKFHYKSALENIKSVRILPFNEFIDNLFSRDIFAMYSYDSDKIRY